MTAASVGTLLLALLFLCAACASPEESRSRALEFCEREYLKTAVVLNPIYRPSKEEVERGLDAFMRECMKNQGYSDWPKSN